jgi:hypothetical protein
MAFVYNNTKQTKKIPESEAPMSALWASDCTWNRDKERDLRQMCASTLCVWELLLLGHSGARQGKAREG